MHFIHDVGHPCDYPSVPSPSVGQHLGTQGNLGEDGGGFGARVNLLCLKGGCCWGLPLCFLNTEISDCQ